VSHCVGVLHKHPGKFKLAFLGRRTSVAVLCQFCVNNTKFYSGMDSVFITTGSPSTNTPNINATRLRGTLVLVLSQAICLASAGMVVVICTGFKYMPKKDQYTKDNTGEGGLDCISGIVTGLMVLTIFGLLGFSMFVIRFISKIKSENPYFDRLRWGDIVAVSVDFMASIMCVVFGAVTKHRQGCVRFLQDKDPNYIFYMNFMIVYGTITTIVDAVFIWLSVQEFDWHQKNKEKISDEQKKREREEQEQKKREREEQEIKEHEEQEKKEREEQEQKKREREEQKKKECEEQEIKGREEQEKRERERREQERREQERRERERRERERREQERRERERRERERREREEQEKEMCLLDQNLVVAKRIETAIDDAVVSTTIRVSEIQETEGGSEFDVQCVTCRNEDPDHAFVPCGHICVCGSCAEIFKGRQDPCPICRGRQNGLIKVFK
jgi:hypothetical protein